MKSLIASPPKPPHAIPFYCFRKETNLIGSDIAKHNSSINGHTEADITDYERLWVLIRS